MATLTPFNLRKRLSHLRALVRNLGMLPSIEEELGDVAHRLTNIEVLVSSRSASHVAGTLDSSVAEGFEHIAQRIEDVDSRFGRTSDRQLQLMQAIYEDAPGDRRRLWELRNSPEYERPFIETNPLVSVCIPTYNNAKDLAERSLPSVLAQSYTNIEIIIVGDASPPEIEEVVRSFDDPRIRFSNLTVRGPYPDDPFLMWLVAGAEPAREALRIANGQWIAQHSDDDAFTEHHIEVLLREAQETRLEIVYGKLRQHEPGKPSVLLGAFPPKFGQIGVQGSLVHGGFRIFPHEPLAVLNVPGDWGWFERMMKLGARIGMIDDIVTDYYPSNSWGTTARRAGSLVADPSSTTDEVNAPPPASAPGDPHSFFAALSDDLVSSSHTFAPRFDHERFGSSPELAAELRLAEQQSSSNSFRRDPADATRLASVLGRIGEYAATWAMLDDEESRRIFVRVLVMQILGPRHALLPLDYERYWAQYDDCAQLVSLAEPLLAGHGFSLGLYDLRAFGRDLTLRCTRGGILAEYVRHQYEYRRDGMSVMAEPGDVVIDGGAAWGDTAFKFATMVTATGRVCSVESLPRHIELFRLNTALNPEIANRITLVEGALWSASGEPLAFADYGPGSRVKNPGEPPSPELICQSVSIDDLVGQLGLERVDYIKLDIEGAERDALAGAAETIARFRPKLAISAYHRPDDLVVLPGLIRQLHPGYRFGLDHHTSHLEETVLYARAHQR